jgi:transposase
MAEEDFYILPYYFDDEGVLKSRVKVGDYITIESEGNSSQKQVLEVKILKSGTRYLLEATKFLPVLLYSIITNDNKQYGKIIISEGDYRGVVYEDQVGDLGSGSYEPLYIDFEFKINPSHQILAFAKGLNERLNEDSPLMVLPVDLFERIVNLLTEGLETRAGGRKKPKKKRRKSKRRKSKRKSKKRKSKRKSKKKKYKKRKSKKKEGRKLSSVRRLSV